MDFLSVIRVIIRRWYVVVSALLISMAISYAVVRSIAPTYQASGSALLVGAPPAQNPDDPDTLNQNPFTRLDASTAVLTAVATQIMDAGPTRESLIAEGASKDYQVGQATDGTPVFVVVATDRDAEVAIGTVNLVLDRLGEELDSRQADAGAPPEARVRSIVITEPDEATELLGGRIRAFLALSALGAAASVSLAFVADAIAQGRERRSQADRRHSLGGEDGMDARPGSIDERLGELPPVGSGVVER
jgi:hypothetical protein